MRGRRQGLQVSTFPFLAVLLCTMGSLILLLLVIDRRAKVVAQVKARQAAAEDEQSAAARRAELERRQEALHTALTQQDQDVASQHKAVQEQTAATTRSLQAEQARVRDLQKQLQAERGRLAQREQEITARRAEAEQAIRQAQGSQAELARLTADLQRLEQTLADLKKARQRQLQTYSLVPYRGRRGDNRRPIYVECTMDGLIFHPDRTALQGLTVRAEEVRAEIDRRIARQRAARPADPGTSQEKPYLLMLVRPDGIVTYYRTQAALKGLPIDFGYEFIDADWILSFPEDDNLPAPQPWMTADKTDVPRRVPMPYAPIRTAPPVRLPNVASGAGAGKEASGSSGLPEPPASRSRLAGLLPSVPNFSGTTQPRTPESLGGERPLPAAPPALPPLSLLLPRGAPAQPNSASPGDPSLPFGGSGGREEIGLPPAGSGSGLRSPSSAPPGDSLGGSQAPSSPGNPRSGSADARLATPSILPPIPGTDRARLTKGTGNPSATSAGESTSRPATGPNQGSREESTASSAAPATGTPVPEPPRQASPSAPGSPGLLVPNRDWIIPIECTADAVVIPSTGQRIATATLPRGGASNNPLREAVEQLIARRQATVRSGEPPYRPQIRFRVQPDGLRSYYLAYPALESLRVPMSRENVERNEQPKTTTSGR